jgi:hypothetical protein
MERCDPDEFVEWIAFYQLEPWGSVVEDQRTGIIASCVANGPLTRTSGTELFRADEFTPQHGQHYREIVEPEIDYAEQYKNTKRENVANKLKAWATGGK